MASTRVYCKGVLEAEDFPMEDVSEHLARPDTVVWVDLCGPSKEELVELADELGLHELAVEDALGPHQRPKVDHYASHLFLACHAVRIDAEQGTLDATEVDAFINKRWLVTVRKNDGFSMEPVLRRWDRSPDLAVYGVSFLLYGLLDVVVDEYFETVEMLDDFFDEISEGIFSETPIQPSQQRHWFEMR
ncbi:MAG TPA: CorA family divalent cation transporter, partial [Acidimicrobiales bacterium]|nr:CorA family divalent cation transporter [Acidimicrobiales bacterium]